MYKNMMDEKNQSGILLAFDDYDTDSWEAAFDLFDEYGVKATFFVNAFGPGDFCAQAKERGHEIGFHTIGHMDLTLLEEEHIIEQAIAPIESFREQGYELTAFAYPYGKYFCGGFFHAEKITLRAFGYGHAGRSNGFLRHDK